MGIPERVAEHGARLTEHDRRLSGHDKALQGDDGAGGLTAGVRNALHIEKTNSEAANVAINGISELCVGKDGEGGFSGDIKYLLEHVKVLVEERENRSKLLWLLIAAVITEGGALVFVWLGGLR